MTKIKHKIININSEKLEEAVWPNSTPKNNKKTKKHKTLTKFIAIILALGLAINFSLGSFAVDITFLLFCLVLILSYYKKYPC